MKKNFIILSIFISFSFNCVFCQSSFNVGINTGVEKTSVSSVKFRIGIIAEKRFCNLNSIQFGLNYRTFTNDFTQAKSSLLFLQGFSVTEKYLTTYLVSTYKINRFFDISFGPSAEIFLAHKDNYINTNNQYPYNYKLDKKILFGLMSKISKKIEAFKNIEIEPELYYNPVFTPYSLYDQYITLKQREYLGIGVSVKYSL